MELVTSGVEEVPKTLTPKGIWDLTFNEHD